METIDIHTRSLTESLPLIDIKQHSITVKDTNFTYGPLCLDMKIFQTDHIIAAVVPGAIDVLYENPTLGLGKFVNVSFVNSSPTTLFETTYGSLLYNSARDKIVFGSFSHRQTRLRERPRVTKEVIVEYLTTLAPQNYHSKIEEILEHAILMLDERARAELTNCGHHLVQRTPHARYFLHARV